MRQTSWLFTIVAKELNSVCVKHLQLVVISGLEPLTSKFQVWHPYQ